MSPCRTSDAGNAPSKSRRRSGVSSFIVTDVARKSGGIKHERSLGCSKADSDDQLNVTPPTPTPPPQGR